MSSTAARYDRCDALVAALLLVLAGYTAVLIRRAPCVVGEYQDDGVYLATGRALATGAGYRHTHLPGEPYQTKYPILYPLLLSAIWRAWPDFPANVAAIQFVSVALWTVGSWLAYRLMRRAWGLPWWLPACGVGFAFAHTATMGLLQTAMSESLYLPLSMAALLASCSTGSRAAAAPPPARRYARGALIGILAGSAYLARTIGIVVIAAALAHLALRRRWRELIVATVLAGLAAGGWQAWCAYGSHANAANPAAVALTYDLDYRAWLPDGPVAALRVAWFNATAALADYGILLWPARTLAIETALFERCGSVALVYAGLVLAAGLTLAGAVAAGRRMQPAVHLYLLGYTAMVLIWPFPPVRFLIVILPLLTTLLLAGAWWLMRWAARLGNAMMMGPAAHVPAGPARSGRTAAAVVALGLAALLSLSNLNLVTFQMDRAGLLKSIRRREALIKLVQDRTPPDAVLCADVAAYLHLRTGRKVVPFLAWPDPQPFLYPADRNLLACGRELSTGARLSMAEYVHAWLPEYLRATGCTHIVPLEETTEYGAAFAGLVRARPGNFRRVAGVAGYMLYEVRLPGGRTAPEKP